MRKPRLTSNVLNGLSTLTGAAEAGTPADILGLDYEELDQEGKKSWDNIERAIEWVSLMQQYIRLKKSGTH